MPAEKSCDTEQTVVPLSEIIAKCMENEKVRKRVICHYTSHISVQKEEARM